MTEKAYLWLLLCGFFNEPVEFCCPNTNLKTHFVGFRWLIYQNGPGYWYLLAIPIFTIRSWRHSNNLFLKELKKTHRTHLLLHFREIFRLELMLPILLNFCFWKTSQFPSCDFIRNFLVEFLEFSQAILI